MARRNGRKGSYLVTDDYFGFTMYDSEIKRDYWGAYAKNPLKRNLQEIASPLNDPEPISVFRGPNYEKLPNGRTCIGENAPLFVGLTNVAANQNNAAFQALNLKPGLGSMSVGCSFTVY